MLEVYWRERRGGRWSAGAGCGWAGPCGLGRPAGKEAEQTAPGDAALGSPLVQARQASGALFPRPRRRTSPSPSEGSPSAPDPHLGHGARARRCPLHPARPGPEGPTAQLGGREECVSKGGARLCPREGGTAPKDPGGQLSVAGMRRPRSHSALAPREGPGKPQRPPGAQVTLPPAQVGTRLWAPGRSQARTEAAGGRDSLPVSATLVQPEVRSARSIRTRVHTCAQNEHMWKRGVFRAGDAQRATRPSQGQKPACVPRPPAGGSRPCGHAPRMPTARASGRTLPPGPGEPSHTEASWRREGQQALEAISSFQGQAAWVRGRLRAWEEPWWAPALGEGGCSRRHARFCTGAVTPRGPGLLPRLGLQRSASQAQAPSAGEHMLPVPGRRSPPHGGWDGRWPPAAGPDVKRSSVGGSLPLE